MFQGTILQWRQLLLLIIYLETRLNAGWCIVKNIHVRNAMCFVSGPCECGGQLLMQTADGTPCNGRIRFQSWHMGLLCRKITRDFFLVWVNSFWLFRVELLRTRNHMQACVIFLFWVDGDVTKFITST